MSSQLAFFEGHEVLILLPADVGLKIEGDFKRKKRSDDLGVPRGKGNQPSIEILQRETCLPCY